ncbi:MAG: SRPBCC domain-containing protein [bacterium]|nr:SRPBCC domain-containing protein [bacterium]
MTLDETVVVAAPADVVWQVVTDLPRYGEWNPFVVACRSTLVPGEPIVMRVRVFRAFAQPQRELVLEHVAGTRLCYGVAPDRLGALASRRCHHVEPLPDGRARYRSHFVLSGWLAPLVQTLLGRRLAAGFQAMTAALARRAEALAAR